MTTQNYYKSRSVQVEIKKAMHIDKSKWLSNYFSSGTCLRISMAWKNRQFPSLRWPLEKKSRKWAWKDPLNKTDFEKKIFLIAVKTMIWHAANGTIPPHTLRCLSYYLISWCIGFISTTLEINWKDERNMWNMSKGTLCLFFFFMVQHLSVTPRKSFNGVLTPDRRTTSSTDSTGQFNMTVSSAKCNYKGRAIIIYLGRCFEILRLLLCRDTVTRVVMR